MRRVFKVFVTGPESNQPDPDELVDLVANYLPGYKVGCLATTVECESALQDLSTAVEKCDREKMGTYPAYVKIPAWAWMDVQKALRKLREARP